MAAARNVDGGIEPLVGQAHPTFVAATKGGAAPRDRGTFHLLNSGFGRLEVEFSSDAVVESDSDALQPAIGPGDVSPGRSMTPDT